MYYAPIPAIRPRKPARAAWLADIAAAVAMIFFIAAIGAEPLPDAVQGGAHRHFVAGFCPHLPKGEEKICLA